MKIIEGSRYNFEVEKRIDFDGSNFWVLKGPDSKKYLLNCADYYSYNIIEGSVLDCRVDKINCKGEVFLEPLHPVYREGFVYEFKVQSFDMRIDKSGKPLKVVLLIDKFNNEVIIPLTYFADKAPALDTSVPLKIDQIVKGSIIVYGSSQTLSSEKEEDNTLYSFKIISESKGMDNRDYFLVEDRDKAQYTIPVEYYSHYNLEIGDIFQGRFIRYKEGHGISVEPLSPFFEPGMSYRFKVIDFMKVSDGIDDIMIIRDSYGYDHHVQPLEHAREGDTLSYRVVKMRKGWPLLEKV